MRAEGDSHVVSLTCSRSADQRLAGDGVVEIRGHMVLQRQCGLLDDVGRCALGNLLPQVDVGLDNVRELVREIILCVPAAQREIPKQCEAEGL